VVLHFEEQDQRGINSPKFDKQSLDENVHGSLIYIAEECEIHVEDSNVGVSSVVLSFEHVKRCVFQ